MSRQLEDLNPSFRELVDTLLRRCSNDGAIMRPFYTLRDVYEQAKLYRQSRCWEEIEKKIEFLLSQQAYFIVDVLQSVGPTYGRWATNALPGESVHQYGYAVDCYSLEHGMDSKYKINWENENPYKIYAHHAKKLGLDPGYLWTNKDSVHVQDGRFQIPDDWAVIDSMMKERFGKE